MSGKKPQKMRRRAKKGTLSWWKQELWKVFAIYIKERDKWCCVTCGRKAKGYGMGAGHYIAKGACSNEYYFSEENVHAQCTYCNLALEGNRPKYREYIIKKYGTKTLKDLETNYNKPTPWSIEDYQNKIKFYKDKTIKLTEKKLNG